LEIYQLVPCAIHSLVSYSVGLLSVQGPWLQLPLELLESLLVLNLDPATISSSDARPPIPTCSSSHCIHKVRGAFHSPGDYHPIDPGVFRSVTTIRKLIDEAAELSVRAASGLSAAALGSMRGGGLSSMNNSAWAAAQSLGINPMGDNSGGRNVAMSAMRVHRLRALAVQKLAQAYKTDEIASSVMVMQGGSVFDDVAERVLKVGMFSPFD
jgi:hypothetical protein